MRRISIVLLIWALAQLSVFGQGTGKPEWTGRAVPESDSTVRVELRCLLSSGLHIYSINTPKGGPTQTELKLAESPLYAPLGAVGERGKLIKEQDPAFGVEVHTYADSAVFYQRIVRRSDEAFKVKSQITFQTCSGTQCDFGDEEITVDVPAKGDAPASGLAGLTTLPSIGDPSQDPGESVAPATEAPAESEGTSSKGFWGFAFLCFLAGLAALLTPCVFPMIPMTVTYFLGKKNRRNALLNALLFGVSIVGLYTLLGLLVSMTSMGAEVITDLTAHWITNSIFFLLFVVFAASFFGLFEIRLPSGISSKTDAQVDKGGWFASFFLALTTTIVSLSCVGPLVGTLLIESASGGGQHALVGMFAFGLGFSLPFLFFALFPSLLQRLPSSGGWMHAVKVVLGFLILGLSLKFLLNVDAALGWGFITRPLYISIWVVLSVFLGAYFLGAIRFEGDPKVETLGFWRMVLALVAFSFALVLARGLVGAPLTSLSGLLPPADPTEISVGGPGNTLKYNVPIRPRYEREVHLPAGLEGYRIYSQAQEAAKALNKPMLVYFTGHTCANCKEMAGKVLMDGRVQASIANNFVLAALYVDDRTDLTDEDRYVSPIDGKEKTTIGRANLDLQRSTFKQAGQPMFFIVSPEGEILAGPQGRELDPDVFLRFLDQK